MYVCVLIQLTVSLCITNWTLPFSG